MMQTISSKLAKELKELDVKQNSYFEWVYFKELEQIHLCSNSLKANLINQGHHAVDIYAAFTLDEILEMLPVCLEIPENDNLLICYLYVAKWGGANYYTFTYNHRSYNLNICMTKVYNDHKNSTEAAGQLLKWCVENGHIKFEEK